METVRILKPVIKWVGGKTQLLDELIKRIPKEYNTYFEAFLGGGALLFAITPKKAKINDFNAELVNLYNTIRCKADDLIKELKSGLYDNSEDSFYKIRNLDRNSVEFDSLSDVIKASRTIYLNKTCYNGLYRVNSKGEFNTPFGRYKNPLICDEENIRNVSKYLKTVSIFNLDFEEFLKKAKAGDFVYLDPPYDVVSKTASFTAYNKAGFSRDEQIRLKEACDKLTSKGVKWMLSNSATPFILELYKDYNIDIVYAKRCINSKGDKRGNVEEVLVRNYKE